MASKSISKRQKRNRAGQVTGEVYRARYRDPSGKEHMRSFAKKKEAEGWLDDQVSKMVTGSWVDPSAGKVTLRTYYAAHVELQLWVPGTRAAMDLAVLNTPFIDVPLASISDTHVRAWMKAMDAELAPRTIKTRMANVHSVFKAAIRDRKIALDPFDAVQVPKRWAAAPVEIPTPEQVGAILAAADDGWRPLFATCALAGTRLGEVSALRIGDIDFLRRTVRVARQVQQINGGVVEVRAPKYGSVRTVEVDQLLLDMLAEHIASLAGDRGRDRYLFGDIGGNPPTANQVNYRWRRSRGDLDVRLHDLRHYFASGLIAGGCDVVTVQKRLGHRSPAVTLSTYSHLFPGSEEKVRNASAVIAQGIAGYLRATGTE